MEGAGGRWLRARWSGPATELIVQTDGRGRGDVHRGGGSRRTSSARRCTRLRGQRPTGGHLRDREGTGAGGAAGRRATAGPAAVEDVGPGPKPPLRLAVRSGRYRQHHQVGIEALGSDDPDLDVEGARPRRRLLRRARACASRLSGMLNTTGDAAAPAPADRETLDFYYLRPLSSLDLRLVRNRQHRLGMPRGVFHPQELCGSSPIAAECPADDRRRLRRPGIAHFSARRARGWRNLAVPSGRHPPRRGEDDDRRTTSSSGRLLDSARERVGGGGRYDGLVEVSGARPRRASVSDSASSARAGVQRRGVLRRRPTRRTTGPSSTRGRPRRCCLRTPFGRQGSAPTAPTSGAARRPQTKAADRSGAAFAVIVGRRGSPPARSSCVHSEDQQDHGRAGGSAARSSAPEIARTSDRHRVPRRRTRRW